MSPHSLLRVAAGPQGRPNKAAGRRSGERSTLVSVDVSSASRGHFGRRRKWRKKKKKSFRGARRRRRRS